MKVFSGSRALCEPKGICERTSHEAGIEDPISYQLTGPGLFDPWFAAIRKAAAEWDGSDPIRDARPLLMAALASS